jgi:hypothetical protein
VMTIVMGVAAGPFLAAVGDAARALTSAGL